MGCLKLPHVENDSPLKVVVNHLKASEKGCAGYYRYGYQGEFSEEDEETGWNSFEYRSWDPVVSRWISPDPARQYWSPYMGMGNNPINQIDPDGAYSKFGAFWRNGFSMNGVSQSGGEWGYQQGTGTFDSYTINGEIKTFEVSEFVFGKGNYGMDSKVPTLTAWEPNMFEIWGMSENILATTSYDLVDGPFVTAQFFTPWRKTTHLDGQGVIGDEGVDAFANTFSNVAPMARLGRIPKLTAPQFSSIFKGNLAKLAPKTRGWLIRKYNKYFIDDAHGTILKGVEGAKIVTESNKE